MALKRKDDDLSNTIDNKINQLDISKDAKSKQIELSKKQNKEEMIIVRMTLSQKEELRRHFEWKGLSLSSGIRMVLIDYLNTLKKN